MPERRSVQPIDFNVQDLTPLDIVLLHRFAVSVLDLGTALTGVNSIQDELYWQLTRLPARDAEHADAVIRCFANSPIPQDRAEAPEYLPAYGRVRPRDAVEIWSQLIRDGDERVRGRSFTQMESAAASESREQPARSRPGLTAAAVLRLTTEYHEAQAGNGIHRLGETAVAEALQATWLSPHPPFPSH